MNDADSTVHAGQEQMFSTSSVVWMTCVVDGREHAVTDEQACAGLERCRGTYDAVCDQTITPQAMTCAPGRRCAACCAVLRAWCHAPRQRGRWLRRGHGVHRRGDAGG